MQGIVLDKKTRVRYNEFDFVGKGAGALICKHCGTESREDFCPRCGEALRPNASVSKDNAGQVPVTSAKSEDAALTTVKDVKKKKRRKPPLRIKMVFWQAVTLFFPLAYLMFDFYAVISDRLLLGAVSGGSQLQRLVERLGDPIYATNGIREIAEATMGESVELFHAVSVFSLLGDLAAGRYDLTVLLIPALLTVTMALLCVVMGVLLLLTGGRILRVRLFGNLTLFAGMGATFSPVLGSFLVRLIYGIKSGFDAAEIAAQRFLPSLEALCIMGILICTLLPALASVKRLAVYAKQERDFVVFPYRIMTKLPFGLTKFVSLACIVLCVGCVAALFVLPVFRPEGVFMGNPIAAFSETWQSFSTGWSVLSAADGGAVNMGLLLTDLFRAVQLLLFPALLVFLIPVIVGFLRVLRARPHRLSSNKRARAGLRQVGGDAGRLLLAPFVCITLAQIFAVCVLLFSSPVGVHMDFANVTDTLSVVYVAVSYVKSLGGVTLLYSILTACGAVMWQTAGQSAVSLVVQSGRSD